MKTRILSGLIMLPLLGVLFFGGYILLVASFIIGIAGVYEFYRGFRNIDITPSYYIALMSSIGLYLIVVLSSDVKWYMLWMFLTVVASLLYMFKIDSRKLEDSMATIIGILYIVFFSMHVTLIERIEDTSILVWLVVITAFGTDIFAYFSGMLFGKNKLCPKISPKKTIEGAIGGTLGSVILSGVFGYFFAYEILVHCLIIGFIGAVFAQFGDLTASIFKRKMGIKDYGNLIPGHGGVLDRFDSVIFTAPVIYYYIQFFVV